MIGAFGNAEVFSFHATKFLNTFEGGAVVTNDRALAAKIRLMRDSGFAGYDEISCIGTNGKMSEVSAAMGLAYLDCLDEFIAVNRSHYHHYLQGLTGIPGVSVLSYDDQERYNYQYVVLEIDEAIAHVSRDQLQDVLWAENVLARRYYFAGCHRMEPYRSSMSGDGLRLPNTERLAEQVLVLPTGTAIVPDEISDICQIIRLAALAGEELSHRSQGCPATGRDVLG